VAARWYGEDIAFRTAVEAGARRRYGRHLCVRQGADHIVDGRHGTIVVPGELIYAADGIPVRGRAINVPIEVHFRPLLPTAYGRLIRAEDYPSVYAEREMTSPHRLHDRALCLYHPGDPLELRWESRMGLLSLLDAAAEHLYFESYWRRHGDWLGDEAPHGFAA
jgi:hypothetical protein